MRFSGSIPLKFENKLCFYYQRSGKKKYYHSCTRWRMKICYHQDPVPERPISANPGLKILFHFRIYLPMHCLEQHSVLSSLYLEVKTPQYFVSSSDLFLDKKTLIKIRVNPGLNLTIFRGTGPRVTMPSELSKQWNDAITYFTCSRISQHWEPFFQNRSRELFPPIPATIDVR